MNREEYEKLRVGMVNLKSATLALFAQMSITQIPNGGFVSKELRDNMIAAGVELCDLAAKITPGWSPQLKRTAGDFTTAFASDDLKLFVKAIHSFNATFKEYFDANAPRE